MGRDDYLRWAMRRCGTLICALVAVAVALPSPAAASAARLYVAVGDSVGAGFGATSGQSYFDLYCAYLESAAAGSLVDQCVNESVVGLTSQSALDGGAIQRAVNDIDGSANTPVVTVVLGGNDLLGSPGCEPITGAGCNFIGNMRTILKQIETALATHPGPHVTQWLEYYNPNHDNPFGNASADQSTAGLLLGNDLTLTGCSSSDLGLIGLDDAINCIAKEKGATPVDAYTPFQRGCTNNDCFSDSLHPDDKGYGLIFDALRDTPGSPVPRTPPPDGHLAAPPHHLHPLGIQEGVRAQQTSPHARHRVLVPARRAGGGHDQDSAPRARPTRRSELPLSRRSPAPQAALHPRHPGYHPDRARSCRAQQDRV
jgi:lysophospholipase L1-like esterase